MHPDTLYHLMLFDYAETQDRARHRYLIREAKLARKAARRQTDPDAPSWRRRRSTRERTAVPATA